jgi:hypothetical protein
MFAAAMHNNYDDDDDDEEQEEQDEEDVIAAREEFIGMCLQLARDESVVDRNDWFLEGTHPRLFLNDADITLLGKCLVGNTRLKVLT